MGRRMAGLLLLVVAVSALIAGSSLFGTGNAVVTRIAGSPRPISVGPLPRVGDCVLWAPDPDPTPVALRTGTADGSVSFGPCSGVVAGEIVAIAAASGRVSNRPGDPGAADPGAVDAGAVDDCWARATTYVGYPEVGGKPQLTEPTAENVQWRPYLEVLGQHVRANVLERAVGRDWSACIVRPANLLSYLGTARAAISGGRAPSAYADCSAGKRAADRVPVSCSAPHARERLGWTTPEAAGQSDAAGLAAIGRSCGSFAAMMMRTADPTLAGAVRVEATQQRAGGAIECSAVVNGAALLGASLIGIADGPLPWLS